MLEFASHVPMDSIHPKNARTISPTQAGAVGQVVDSNIETCRDIDGGGSNSIRSSTFVGSG